MRLLISGEEAAGDRFQVRIMADLLYVNTDFSMKRESKQRDPVGVGQIECDATARVGWTERRFFFLRVGKTQGVRISRQIACQDNSQKGSRRNKALTIARKMKAGGACRFVGRKHRLPPGFIATNGVQIDSP